MTGSWFRILVLLTSLAAFVGCGPSMFLSERDNDIKAATQAIDTARNDGQRAKAYSSRGTAYSEKARYSRVMKQRPDEEYERWFDLAIQDHNQAVELDPGNAEVYANRAQAYYDRGAQELAESKNGKPWLDSAAADFERAIERGLNNAHTFDMLGLTYESNGEEDKAIQAYTRELPLDSFGKQRLADAYCDFGVRHQQQGDYAAALEAYQKSIEFGVADDKSCIGEPLGEMVRIYTVSTRQYDKAWETVHQAQRAGRWIAPELLERLKRDSARTN